MKAAQIREYGGIEVVTVVADAPEPAAGTGMVLVEVHAASLNPVDSAVRAGYMRQAAGSPFPLTLGGDIAGVVSAVGADVSGIRVGDRVFGTASVLAGGSGAFAERALAAPGLIAKIPLGIGFTEAAALPLAGVSALQALETLKVGEGTKLLVHGGSGGVGVFAIQVARNLGARVATTVRGRSAAFVKGLGAEQAIDFETEAFDKLLKDYDAVLDNVGGEVLQRSFAVVRRGGAIISMIGEPDAALARKRGVTAAIQMTQVTTARLERLISLVARGKVKVPVHAVLPLDKVREAFAQREGGGIRGKLVVQIA